MATYCVSDLAINDPKHQRRMIRWIQANLRQLNGSQLNEVLNITWRMLPEVPEEFDADVLEAAAEYEQRLMLESLPVSSARPS